ncbi:MAG: sigma 54-interacting transcriptional regulator [Rubricella sp.]
MTEPRASILIASTDLRHAGRIADALAGCEVLRASDRAGARALMEEAFVEVLVIDGALMPALEGQWPEVPRIRLGDGEGGFLALPRGAAPETVVSSIEGALAHFRLGREADTLRVRLKTRSAGSGASGLRDGAFDGIIRGPGSPMEEVIVHAARIAGFDLPALILGETGTGKELVARAIHDASLRADGPFVPVNCGAIPDELLESELFGHVKGAFTGAHQRRLGLVEAADGGTLFLDEIGDTSPAFQVKLLRFLQEAEVRPVGSDEVRRVDVRVIAATNRDPKAEVEEGRFRSDLYWRLAVAPLTVPPLRERACDIGPISRHLLAGASSRYGKRAGRVDPEAAAALLRHDWPGNVRELENAVLRMLMLSDGERIGAEHLEPAILGAHGADSIATEACAGQGTLKDRVEWMEAQILHQTLIRHNWNKSRAADELGLSRVGLRAKLDRYGIAPAQAMAAE